MASRRAAAANELAAAAKLERREQKLDGFFWCCPKCIR